MSIGPVQALGPESATQTADAYVGITRTRSAADSTAALSGQQTDSGRLRNQEILSQQNSETKDESPQDVVQVQRDSQVSNEIVIKYTDQATGRVILQVPSSEVLAVAQGITQDLRHETKAGSNPAGSAVEGADHGH
jgi:uncharacterized FlaG/YvyC family protein